MIPFPRPDFDEPRLAAAPDARFAAAPADGLLPDDFYPTTNLPTWIKVDGAWRMPREPRMDAVIVRDPDGALWAREMRRVKRGDAIAVGHAEDGTEGIFVQPPAARAKGDHFRFMSSAVSREKPIDYAQMARVLIEERGGGYPVWVVGPALVHARAREDLIWFIEHGFVGALLVGNAVAAHDIEAALYDTTLGMSASGDGVGGGHGMHLRAINRVRAAGSIEAAVAQGVLTSGVMHACVVHRVPFVLAGSIRDDGPLPGVYTDAIEAQDAMRRHTVRATAAILIASALHSIAVGNMLPSFVEGPDGALRELPTIGVDASEFVVEKLRDRGTHQAFGVVTNARDFLHVLRLYIERAGGV